MNTTCITQPEQQHIATSVPTGSGESITMWKYCQLLIRSLLKPITPDMATASRIGSSHKINQDSVLNSAPGYPVIAVADGISNSNCGEKASHAALMLLALIRPKTIKDLENYVFAADAWVKESFGLFGAGRPGQTTVVAASIKRGAVVDFISIGDSRVYLLRQKGFLRQQYFCEQCSVDQTHGERKKRVRYKHPAKYRDDMMVHAIGAGLISSEVKAQRQVIPPGGLLLIATDGLYAGMGEDHCNEIARIAARHAGADAAQLAQYFVSEAAEHFDTGDDISVGIIIPTYALGCRWPFWLAGLLTTISLAIGIYC